MDPSWEREVPTPVDRQVVVVHTVRMQQGYVDLREHVVPIQVGERPLEAEAACRLRELRQLACLLALGPGAPSLDP